MFVNRTLQLLLPSAANTLKLERLLQHQSQSQRMMISNDFSEKNRKLLTDYQAEFNRLRRQGKSWRKSGNEYSSSSSNGSSSSGYSSNEGGVMWVQMRGAF